MTATHMLFRPEVQKRGYMFTSFSKTTDVLWSWDRSSSEHFQARLNQTEVKLQILHLCGWRTNAGAAEVLGLMASLMKKVLHRRVSLHVLVVWANG